jgi:hypothetical protein
LITSISLLNPYSIAIFGNIYFGVIKMKTFYLLLISIIIFYGNILAQQTGWSSVIRLTNSKTMDRHPSMPQRLGRYTFPICPIILAYDRTDSLGTNICVMETKGENWDNRIYNITGGNEINEINEYPSASDKMVVFQKREKNYSNIYYSMKLDSGWSTPETFTNDTNKINIKPKIFYDIGSDPNIWVVWEKDRKVYYKMFNGTNWTNELKVTPEDTFSYTNPVITLNNIAFEKRIDNEKQYIYSTKPSGSTFILNPIDTGGYNRNPKFISGWNDYLTWEKFENNKWKIYQRRFVGSTVFTSTNAIGMGDSIYDYNDFAGIFIAIPISNSMKKEENNKGINTLNTIACLCNRSNDKLCEIMGGDMLPRYVISQSKANNPTISQSYINGRHKAWAVWESEKDGYTNLYGASYDILPTAVEENKESPEFELYQNYPNPFNPNTVISYSVQTTHALSVLQIKVYDILGREVKTLVNENKAPGKYDVVFDGKNLSSGVYFCRLSIKDKNGMMNMVKQIPMLLLK